MKISDNPIKYDTLRTLRIKFGLTQKEAAEMLGIAPSTLNSWEKDSSNLSYSMIQKIEEIFGVSQDHIFFGAESTFSELVRKGNMKNAGQSTFGGLI